MKKKNIFCKLCAISLNPLDFNSHSKGKKHLSFLPDKLTIEGKITSDDVNKLKEYFTIFGNVSTFVTSKIGNKICAQISFSDPSVCTDVIQADHKFNGEPLKILWDIQKSQPKKKTLDHSDIMKQIKSTSNFDGQIQILSLCLKEDDKQIKIRHGFIHNDLCLILSQVFKTFTIHYFGSSATGVNYKGSDLDICLEVEDSKDKTEINKLRKIQKLLSKSNTFSNIVSRIDKHKYPFDLIKCKHTATQILCDIYVNGKLLVANRQLIKYYISLDEKIRLLIIAIKYWMDYHEFKKSFTPYALYMLIIFYLQQKPYSLPSVFMLQRKASPIIHDGWNCAFSEIEVNSNRIKEASLFELFKGFFEFYSKFDYLSQVVCPFLGRSLQKFHFVPPCDSLPDCYTHYKNIAVDHTTSLEVNTPMCIQDPFAHTNSIIGSTNLLVGSKFIQYCQNLAHIFVTKRLFSDALNALAVNTAEFDFAKTTTSIQSDKEWLDLAKKLVHKVLTEIFYFDLKNEPCNECDILYICFGGPDIWQNRHAIHKDLLPLLPRNIDLLNQEIAVTSYIAKHLKQKCPVNIAIWLKSKAEPTRLNIKMKSCSRNISNAFLQFPHYMQLKLSDFMEIISRPKELDYSQQIREVVDNFGTRCKNSNTATTSTLIEKPVITEEIENKSISEELEDEVILIENVVEIVDLTEENSMDGLNVSKSNSSAPETLENSMEKQSISDNSVNDALNVIKSNSSAAQTLESSIEKQSSNENSMDDALKADKSNSSAAQTLENDVEMHNTNGNSVDDALNVDRLNFATSQMLENNIEKQSTSGNSAHDAIKVDKSNSSAHQALENTMEKQSTSEISVDVTFNVDKSNSFAAQTLGNTVEYKSNSAAPEKLEKIVKKRSTRKSKSQNDRQKHSSHESRRSETRSRGKKRSYDMRRDPEKTRRDILRDKLVKGSDKENKLVSDKLRLVETGLIAPGSEMEVDLNSLLKSKQKSEEGRRSRRSGSRHRSRSSLYRPAARFRRRSGSRERRGLKRSRSRRRSKSRDEAKRKRAFFEEVCDKINEVNRPAPFQGILPNTQYLEPIPITPAPVAPTQYNFNPAMNMNLLQQQPITCNTSSQINNNVQELPTIDLTRIVEEVVRNIMNSAAVTKETAESAVEAALVDVGKFFAGKKTTFPDFSADSDKPKVDFSNGEDMRKKMTVLMRCYNAMKVMNIDRKFKGRPCEKSSVPDEPEAKLSGEFKSPLRKIPIVRFRYTSPTKPLNGVDSFAKALDSILIKSGIIQETVNLDDLPDAQELSCIGVNDRATSTILLKSVNDESIDGMKDCEECRIRKLKSYSEVGSQCVDIKETAEIGAQVSELDFSPVKVLSKNDSLEHLISDKEKQEEIVLDKINENRGDSRNKELHPNPICIYDPNIRSRPVNLFGAIRGPLLFQLPLLTTGYLNPEISNQIPLFGDDMNLCIDFTD